MRKEEFKQWNKAAALLHVLAKSACFGPWFITRHMPWKATQKQFTEEITTSNSQLPKYLLYFNFSLAAFLSSTPLQSFCSKL